MLILLLKSDNGDEYQGVPASLVTRRSPPALSTRLGTLCRDATGMLFDEVTKFRAK